jgi:hypothetical protein
MKVKATAKQIRALLQLAQPSAEGSGRSGGAERYQSLVDAGRTPAV